MINSEPMEAASRPPRGDGGLRSIRRRRGRTPVFAVTSGQSGVGKTTIVANLVAALALKQKRVLAIDAALGRAALNRFFDIKPVYSLGDFFAGAAALDEILVEHGDDRADDEGPEVLLHPS